MTIRHLLERKGWNVWTIGPDATVLDAVAKMADKDVGSLVVMEGEKFVGIITERHYSRNVVLKGKTSPTTLVREIMETNVIHVRSEHSVELCMALMTDKRVRHLPVVEDTKVIGIVSIGDLLKCRPAANETLVAAPHFPAASWRVRTKPPARVLASCTRRPSNLVSLRGTSRLPGRESTQPRGAVISRAEPSSRRPGRRFRRLREGDHWAADALGAPHVGERPEKQLSFL